MIDHIRALHHCLDHTNTFNITVYAIACIAFCRCCRLGELLLDTTYDSKAHVSHSTAITCGTSSNSTKFINFDIPCTKTKADSNRINISDSTCVTSPILAFEHHLAANTNVPMNAPLFAFEMAENSWSPMKCTWFLDRCNEIWHEEGISSALEHGFQIGSTTHLLLLGVDPWIVMAQGHWTSQLFLGYWRKCEEILSLFISFSFQSCDSILTTMSTFKSHLLNGQ